MKRLNVVAILLVFFALQISTIILVKAAEPDKTDPALAYDSITNRYLMVYEEDTAGGDIYGQFVDAEGTWQDGNFSIATSVNGESQPSVAFSTSNGRYLVVWEGTSTGSQDIHGQLINADGSLNGGQIIISNNGESQNLPKVCYDSKNNRFVAIWGDSRGTGRSVYGQIVNSDGTLFGTGSDVNFVITDSGNNVSGAEVAFDSFNDRFLALWNDDRNGNWGVYGQIMNADGTHYGTATDTNFPIANEGSHQMDPSLTYDSANHRYLVSWTDWRNKGSANYDYDIYGQIINSDGSLFSTASNVNFAIATNNGGQTSSIASYSRAQQRFFIHWQDARGGLYGQYLQADGMAVETAPDVNFSVVNKSVAESVVKYNNSHANFLIAFENHSDPSDIELYVQGEANPPEISIVPNTVNFGEIEVNTDSIPATITVTNNGTSPLFIENLVKSGDNYDQFYIQNDNVSGQEIAPDANATFEVVFSPSSEGEKYADITITSNDPDEHSLIITVCGGPPDIDVTPGDLRFGNITVNQDSSSQIITVVNRGLDLLVLDDLLIRGENSDQFSIQNDNVSGNEIGPDASATFEVVFSPTSEGSKLADILIPSNDPDESTIKMTVSGNGKIFWPMFIPAIIGKTY